MFILQTKSDLQKVKVGTISFLLRPMILDCILRYHISNTVCTFGRSIHKIRNYLAGGQETIQTCYWLRGRLIICGPISVQSMQCFYFW